MVLESGQITLSMDNIGQTSAKEGQNRWYPSGCWLLTVGSASSGWPVMTSDLVSRPSEAQRIGTCRWTGHRSIFCQIAFQAGKHTHLGLFHCFLFSLLSLFPILLALHHFLMFLDFPVIFFLLWSRCSRGQEQFGLIYWWFLPLKALHAKGFQRKNT